MQQNRLKSVEFREEREATWLELEAILDKVEARGLGAASAEELSRLPQLYRAALSSLSVARSISLDRNLAEYLEGLCARAYIVVYSPRRRLLSLLRQFINVDFPLGVYRLRWHLLASTLVFLLGVGVAMTMVFDEPEMFHSFVSPAYAQGRGPETPTAELRQALFDGGQFSAGDLGQFSSFLMTHNSKIGMMCFVLGFALGIPVIYLLFENGLVLGSFNAVYISKGLGVELFSWLLPHGITEILAVLLCGAAGFYIGEAVIFPGRHTRLENLAIRGKQAGVVVVGAVAMFVAAGLIEGVFRQTVQSVPVRYAVATGTALFWIIYLGIWAPLKRREVGDEDR